MIHFTFQREPVRGRILRGDVRIPDGPPPRSAIVIVHGFKGFKDWAFFPHLARTLAAAGHSVVSFNFSGSGIGPDLERFTDLEGFAANTFSRESEELAWIFDWVTDADLLPRKPAAIGLLGHSRGGGDAILRTAQGPGVNALVTWNAVSHFHRWNAATLDEWRKAGRIYVANQRTGQQMPLDIGIIEDLERNRDRLDVTAAAARVEVPWLILHGEKDSTVELAEAQTLAREARAGRLHVIAGAGHTFDVGHPFTAPSPALREAIEESVSHFAQHLNG